MFLHLSFCVSTVISSSARFFVLNSAVAGSLIGLLGALSLRSILFFSLPLVSAMLSWYREQSSSGGQGEISLEHIFLPFFCFRPLTVHIVGLVFSYRQYAAAL